MNDERTDCETRCSCDQNQIIHDFLRLRVENLELLNVDCGGPANRRNEIASTDDGRHSRLFCVRIRGSDGVLTVETMTFN